MKTASNRRRELPALDPSQRAVAERAPGPLLVVAGPGSGKTRVVVHRIASLVTRHRAPSENLLALTYTNAGARELRQRALALAPAAARDITVATFHSFALSQLRRHAGAVRCRSDFTIADRDDQKLAMTEAMRHHGIDPREIRFSSLLSVVSRAKTRLLNPRRFRRETDRSDHDDPVAATAARVWPTYQRVLANANAMDRDDLIVNLVRALERSEELREALGRRYTDLLVDEFQDTDPAQYRLCALLDQDNRRMTAVGDPDQSIFGWRGADPENMVRFVQDYPDAHIANLKRGYRSTPQILDGARSLMVNNRRRIDLPLVSDLPDGEPIHYCVAADLHQEARAALDFVTGRLRRRGLSPDHGAALFRANRQSRPLEEVCVQEGIPYRLLGGVPFYQRGEVRNLLAYLRFLHNPADTMSFHRIFNLPPRGINPRTRQVFMRYARNHDLAPAGLLASLTSDAPPELALSPEPREALAAFARTVARLLDLKGGCAVHELAGHILEITGLDVHTRSMGRGEERWENVLEFMALCREYDGVAASAGLAAFLDHVALFDRTEQHAAGPERITLSTLHSAKGAEFASVAIVGLNEGVLPYDLAEDVQGERRLCYVGMTRAKEHLILTRSRTDAASCVEPSRFIAELGRLQCFEHSSPMGRDPAGGKSPDR